MKPYVSDEPDISCFQLTENDKFIVLACQLQFQPHLIFEQAMLWDELSDQDVVDIVKENPEPFQAANAVKDYAFINGSDDNIRYGL